MRQRSAALHAESVDEYKSKMKILSSGHEQSNRRISVSAYTPVSKFSAKEILEVHELYRRERPQKSLDYIRAEAKLASPDILQAPLEKMVIEKHETRSSISSNPEETSCSYIQKTLECMILGFSKVGKHFLVDACFEEATDNLFNRLSGMLWHVDCNRLCRHCCHGNF